MRINKNTSGEFSLISPKASSVNENLSSLETSILYTTETVANNDTYGVWTQMPTSTISNVFVVHSNNEAKYYSLLESNTTASNGRNFIEITDVQEVGLKVFYTIDVKVRGERLIDDFSTTVLPSTNKTSFSLESYQKDLEYLNRKIEANRKFLTSWDMYNIRDVAYNRADLITQIGKMSTNSSIVVNLEEGSAVIGDVTYKRGDIIVKDIYGKTHIVPGSSGGYYFPYSIKSVRDGGSTYELSFQYTTDEPVLNSVTLNDNENVEPAKNMTIQINTGDSSSGSYGRKGILAAQGDVDIVPIKWNNQLVYPVVYFYLNGERILFDEDYSVVFGDYGDAQSKITLNNKTMFELEYEVR